MVLDWANTVLRLALFGNAGDDYPVTHLRQHSNYQIVTDEDTVQSPKHII
jgi:glucosamine-6-phosphate deaminase